MLGQDVRSVTVLQATLNRRVRRLLNLLRGSISIIGPGRCVEGVHVFELQYWL